MKVLQFASMLTVTAIIVTSVFTPVAGAISMPNPSDYCIAISPRPQVGFVHSCGYTRGECARYLPGVIAKYKKENPKFRKTTVGSCYR